MELTSLETNGKMVTLLGEAGGAVGLICGVLLLAMFFFLRHLMQSLQARDWEMIQLNQQLQKALVNNTAAMTTLAHILQRRRCLAEGTSVIDQLNQATKPDREE